MESLKRETTKKKKPQDSLYLLSVLCCPDLKLQAVYEIFRSKVADLWTRWGCFYQATATFTRSPMRGSTVTGRRESKVKVRQLQLGRPEEPIGRTKFRFRANKMFSIRTGLLRAKPVSEENLHTLCVILSKYSCIHTDKTSRAVSIGVKQESIKRSNCSWR